MTVTRFAPSPTGYMHIGNLRTALYSYLVAKHDNGNFILRIEDTDRERLVEGATDIIMSTLEITGLKYDEGPGVGGDHGPYVQSERKEIYMEYAKKLVELGYLVKKDEKSNRYDFYEVSRFDGKIERKLVESEALIFEGTMSQQPPVPKCNKFGF